jgi:alpha-glucosidase/alpha-D-xyloside xylohydrolase
MWLHYPEDAEAVKSGDEYLWGRDILVAPVVEKGVTERRVYLPTGQWFDWWADAPTKPISGDQWVTRSVDLGTLPMYVRAGAIIPLDPVRQCTSQAVSEPTIIRVYPGGDGSFTLYDDDGHTRGYQNGSDPHEVWIEFKWNDATRRLTISPGARMKRWPETSARVFSIQLDGEHAKPSHVEFAGERIDLQL